MQLLLLIIPLLTLLLLTINLLLFTVTLSCEKWASKSFDFLKKKKKMQLLLLILPLLTLLLLTINLLLFTVREARRVVARRHLNPTEERECPIEKSNDVKESGGAEMEEQSNLEEKAELENKVKEDFSNFYENIPEEYIDRKVRRISSHRSSPASSRRTSRSRSNSEVEAAHLLQVLLATPRHLRCSESGRASSMGIIREERSNNEMQRTFSFPR